MTREINKALTDENRYLVCQREKAKETKPEWKVRNQAKSNQATAWRRFLQVMAFPVHPYGKSLATGQPPLYPEAKLSCIFTSCLDGLLISRVSPPPPICFLLFICLVMQQCSSEEHGFILSRTFITALQTLESKALRMNKCRLSLKTNLQTLA